MTFEARYFDQLSCYSFSWDLDCIQDCQRDIIELGPQIEHSSLELDTFHSHNEVQRSVMSTQKIAPLVVIEHNRAILVSGASSLGRYGFGYDQPLL